MALTEEQTTAKNFQEFYSKIRPYLNGSFPTPIVNKFSKGDLYSTDEKIIGQWIDGKPLYQRTFVASGSLALARAAWTDATTYFGVDVTVVGKIIDATLLNQDGTVNGMRIPLHFDLYQNKFQIYYDGSIQDTIVNAVLTLKYTKTTDSPISIGDGNDYSTDEQVVGTWIDGKPVYQKVVDLGSNVTIGTSWYNTNVSGSDIAIIPSAFSIANTGTFFMVAGVAIINGNINIQLPSEHGVRYIILTYTKTTDTATS